MAACEGLCEYLVKDKYNTFCPATPQRHDPEKYDIKAGNVYQNLKYASLIGHFRITSSLFLKASLGAHPSSKTNEISFT